MDCFQLKYQFDHCQLQLVHSLTMEHCPARNLPHKTSHTPKTTTRTLLAQSWFGCLLSFQPSSLPSNSAWIGFFTSQSSEEEIKGKNEKVQQDSLSHSVPCQIVFWWWKCSISCLPVLWMVCHRRQDPHNVAVYRGCSIVIPDVILHIFVSSARDVQLNIYLLFL